MKKQTKNYQPSQMDFAIDTHLSEMKSRRNNNQQETNQNLQGDLKEINNSQEASLAQIASNITHQTNEKWLLKEKEKMKKYLNQTIGLSFTCLIIQGISAWQALDERIVNSQSSDAHAMVIVSHICTFLVFMIFALAYWNRIRLQRDFSLRKCYRYKNCKLALTGTRFIRLSFILISFFCNNLVFGISIKQGYLSFTILSSLQIVLMVGIIVLCFKEIVYIKSLLLVLYDLLIGKDADNEDQFSQT